MLEDNKQTAVLLEKELLKTIIRAAQAEDKIKVLEKENIHLSVKCQKINYSLESKSEDTIDFVNNLEKSIDKLVDKIDKATVDNLLSENIIELQTLVKDFKDAVSSYNY